MGSSDQYFEGHVFERNKRSDGATHIPYLMDAAAMAPIAGEICDITQTVVGIGANGERLTITEDRTVPPIYHI